MDRQRPRGTKELHVFTQYSLFTLCMYLKTIVCASYFVNKCKLIARDRYGRPIDPPLYVVSPTKEKVKVITRFETETSF